MHLDRRIVARTQIKLSGIRSNMLQPKLVMVLILFIAVPSAPAQELHDWKGKAGHTTKAAFLKVDETARRVTILIPKDIDFDKLDDDSIALARKLASSSIKANVALIPEKKVPSDLRFLREKYEALSRFKSNADFAEWGFSVDGPYNEWMQSVKEAHRQQKPIDVRAINSGIPHVSTGVGELLSLGLEYSTSKGVESKLSIFFEGEIKKILSGNPGPEWPSEKTLDGPIANGRREYKYVEDDAFPDIYAFHSVAQLRNYWERKRQNPNLTARERNELGIELVESRTRILIISRTPYSSVTIFEFEPTTGRNKGRRLFT
jgi:hypothetical protein